MKNFLHLLKNEIRSLFHAPSTYLAMVLAVSLMGFLYFITLVTISSEEQELMPPSIFFSMFWIPVLLIVPMLTMRSIAEERRLGTIETLLTAPVRPTQVVLAKYFAAYGFYLLVWALAAGYPLITSYVLEQPEISHILFHAGSMVGGYLFIGTSGALFVAIGVFSSSLTRSQLVAGMLSFSILFMLIIGVAAINILQLKSSGHAYFSDVTIAYFQIFDHFEDFSRGLIDTRPFVYYLSGTSAVLILSVLILESKA